VGEWVGEKTEDANCPVKKLKYIRILCVGDNRTVFPNISRTEEKCFRL
jgi:hypothetical protein